MSETRFGHGTLAKTALAYSKKPSKKAIIKTLLQEVLDAKR